MTYPILQISLVAMSRLKNISVFGFCTCLSHCYQVNLVFARMTMKRMAILFMVIHTHICLYKSTLNQK